MASRNTVQRQIVFDAVNALRTHPTAEEIYERIHRSAPTVGKATVYRNLAVLAASGRIRHVEVPNSADIYDFNTADHDHVQCISCRRVFDADFPAEPCPPIPAGSGFRILSRSVLYTGLCPDCLKRSQKL